MSEPTPAPAPEPTPTPAEPTPPAGVDPDAWKALGDPGKRAISAEREAREAAEKAAAEYKTKLDEIEKANLSEVERAKREAEEARTALATAKAEAMRARIQAKHGISDEDAELFLTASDEATLAKQAERLAAREADRKKQGNRAPLQGQTKPSSSAISADEREFANQLFGAAE